MFNLAKSQALKTVITIFFVEEFPLYALQASLQTWRTFANKPMEKSRRTKENYGQKNKDKHEF